MQYSKKTLNMTYFSCRKLQENGVYNVILTYISYERTFSRCCLHKHKEFKMQIF